MIKDKELILVVDDEKNTRESLCKILIQEGYSVLQAKKEDDAIEIVKNNPVDLLITDLCLPGHDGLHLFRQIKKEYPSIQVILMTAYGTVESAVEAMKEGVSDYLTKPVNIDEMLILINKILQGQKLLEENKYLREKFKSEQHLDKIIWKCSQMQNIYNLIQQVAPARSTVLIYGESGTGKELIANALHYSGSRKDRPLIKVSCAAIPEMLLESELFGHEKGSFTGAIERRKGLFELAHTGTIFLDEIGEMSLGLQSKLLRILEEREFQRVGGNISIKVDVRVISATNKDLPQLIKEGKFREDLFYRLNVVKIFLPPLRERKEDLPILVDFFIDELSKETNRHIKGVSPEVMQIFNIHNWPGNIRELKNCLESAIVRTSKNILDASTLPSYLRQENNISNFDLKEEKLISLDEIEKKTIIHTLNLVEGNKTKAAGILGIGLKTLYRKLKKYGMEM
ncbi:sigma-54-dependent Fis family transcriptional regulator [Candidatus Desantisbacteria bacterium]|nr:sigma-54-dependent Fis family transcriptional regulator [Candidatus Desantisbacteria bacterium]